MAGKMIRSFFLICLGCYLVNGQSRPQIKEFLKKFKCDTVNELSPQPQPQSAVERFLNCREVIGMAEDIKPYIRFTFRLLDHNPSNGQVTYDEITSKIQEVGVTLEQNARYKFGMSDSNNDGALDLDEYARGAVLSYSMWMHIADRDGNGRLTKDEFRKLIHAFSHYAYRGVDFATQFREINSLKGHRRTRGGYTVKDLIRVDTHLFETYVTSRRRG